MKNQGIITLLLLAALPVFSIAQQVTIKPNWKKGDERHVTASTKMVCLLGKDTIINTSATETSRIKVENSTKDGYIVSYTYESMETPKISMPMLDTIDKAQAVFAVLGSLMKAIENVAKELQVNYRIDPAGEAVSIEDFDKTFNNYIKATLAVFRDFTASLKSKYGDSLDLPIDSNKVKTMAGALKDKFRQQLLNEVNYFNQAYYEMTYDKTKIKTTKAVIKDIDVMRYGDVKVPGNVITEVLKTAPGTLKVKITTQYDNAALKKVFKEQLGKQVDGLSSITDWMVLEYEPNSFWIRKIEESQQMKINEMTL